MNPPFEPRLAQVAIVVSDIEETAGRFASLLGIERPAIHVTRPGDEVAVEYRGRATSSRAKLAFLDLGGVQLELIQPIGEDSAWAERFSGGNALHHIAFWTDDMSGASASMAAHGAPLAMRGDFDDGSGEYAYFDGHEHFGCFIELLARKG